MLYILSKKLNKKGVIDDEGFTIAEVERLNDNNKDEEIVYHYEEV